MTDTDLTEHKITLRTGTLFKCGSRLGGDGADQSTTLLRALRTRSPPRRLSHPITRLVLKHHLPYLCQVINPTSNGTANPALASAITRPV
jgi:hypothetical protein